MKGRHNIKASYVNCQCHAMRVYSCNLPDLPSLPDLACLVVQVQCEGGFTGPELLVDLQDYDYALDMWSLGCMFAGKHCFWRH